MLPRRVICSCLLLLAACTNPPARPVAIKQWSRDEQIQIAKERNALADSNGTAPLFDRSGQQVTSTIAPAVFGDWERMRRELRQ
jgi:hypothetical protein